MAVPQSRQVNPHFHRRYVIKMSSNALAFDTFIFGIMDSDTFGVGGRIWVRFPLMLGFSSGYESKIKQGKSSEKGSSSRVRDIANEI